MPPSSPTGSVCEQPKRSGSQRCATQHSRLFKNVSGRYKRIRHRPKGKAIAAHYELQVEKLKELEKMSETGETDLYYGDETHVCSEGYVPYSWQFPDEDMFFVGNIL